MMEERIRRASAHGSRAVMVKVYALDCNYR